LAAEPSRSATFEVLDKAKKNIYYEHATLKVYDIPIFYFPKFYHPDPTVKRQSGFLTPFFTTSTSLGAGFGLPYYWAISNDKDLTFTPKTYTKENILFLNEYRQAKPQQQKRMVQEIIFSLN
jgi:LPS-assembly protein